MPGTPLSLPEREEIAVALIEDRTVPWIAIGRRIGRHATTVMREVLANGGRARYRPALAERRADKERCRLRPRRLELPGELRDRVDTAEPKLGGSPEAIWADLVAEGSVERVCTETIYAALYAGVLGATDRVPADETQQQAPPPGPPRDQAPGPAQHRRSPRRGQQRAEVGHWEGDQIIGKANRSSMQLLTERVTRYSIGVTMPEGYADGAMLAGLADGLDRIPPHLLRSITFDQGSEWGCSETVASTYGMDVWFSDPHSPWQRGQVENLNRQWRFWFPWGTDLASVARAHVDHVASMSKDSAAAASATRASRARVSRLPVPSDHRRAPARLQDRRGRAPDRCMPVPLRALTAPAVRS